MKNLALITQGRNTCIDLQNQLECLLGNYVTVKGYFLDGGLPKTIESDLIVLTSKKILPKVHPYANACPFVITRRSINYQEVEKILDIPVNTDVLFVNTNFATTRQAIAQLTALGINHIKIHPYVPGSKCPNHYRWAITPGELDLVPTFVKKIIDIKSRMIDFTSLVEILEKLSLLDEMADLLSANYLHNMVDLIKKDKRNSDYTRIIKNQLQTIIDTVHDGIIAVDDKNCISVFNPTAEKLLGVPAETVLGRKVDKITDKNMHQIFNNEDHEKERFIKINARHIVMNSSPISKKDTTLGTVYTFKDISEIQRLEKEHRRKLINEQNFARYTLDMIHGNSKSIKAAISLAQKIALSNSPILIQGESGTGKELFAQGIHNESTYRNGPFIAVNFAALTETLLESELFGYEEGAFTGARKGGAAGLFEQAHNGTIFLDEIGDVPLSFQVKILRVLQEKQVRRIGGFRVIPINARVIAATNRKLQALIAQGTFRQDLFYRLNVLPLQIPALKHRRADIPLLAEEFYDKYFKNRERQVSAKNYFKFVMPYFLAYHWPGNIRELQNVVEYLVNICPETAPQPSMLPTEICCNLPAAKNQAQQHDLRLAQEILLKIKEQNDRGKPIGRRSLATAFNIPESTIRGILKSLEQKGCLMIRKGRKGLQAIKTD